MAEPGRRDWVDTVGKLLIPLVILMVGQEYACQKDRSDHAQRQFDRDATLLRSLASKDENEKLVTLAFIDYLTQKDEFPRELLLAVRTVATGSRSDPSTQQAQLTLQKAVDKDPSLIPQLQFAAKDTPTRVYIQIADQTQRARAQQLQSVLQSSGFVVPGIELRSDNSPTHTEIRYFSADDKAQAQQILNIMQHWGFAAEEKDASSVVKVKVPLKQIEIWIGRNEPAALSENAQKK